MVPPSFILINPSITKSTNKLNQSKMSIPQIFLLLISTFSLINPSLSDPRTTEAALICANSTAAPSDRNPFVPNFLSSLDSLTPQISSHRYGTSFSGTGNTTVYAYGECMRDLSKHDCDLCFAQCKTQILRCLPFQQLTRGGRLFYDGCYLRYDKYMFFNESLTSVHRTVCLSQNYSSHGDRVSFRRNVGELVRNLSVEGVRKNGFAVGVVGSGNLSVYGLAQCWKFVNMTSCGQCLTDSADKIQSCFDMNLIEGRVLNSGCYMRYSLSRFYDNSTDDQVHLGHGDSQHLAIALASAFGALALVLFISAASFLLWRRILRHQREKAQLGALLATINKSKLNFSYEFLERATDYFHASNKLGQGGSGAVYKGVLPDGRNIAVKRLMFNTRQWVDHFFNEVNLISNIDHKNLVKLLGCSITGPESLLVYEFVPNQSLHDHLFGRKKGRLLSWEERYKIILGTAEGLAYLHEGSNLRIIHRDIKLSNVLLDGQYLPKIADFGLARLFPEDKTHISTAIAGTLGYMAPEYVVHGKLTEKADVYSFGVLLVEVISGQRNNSFTQNPSSILQILWTLYESGRIHEAADPSMNGEFRQQEASRLLQIGLLCAQASAELRPSMISVVKMLSENEDIPQPTQPPFLNSSSSEFPNHRPATNSSGNSNSMTESWIEAR